MDKNDSIKEKKNNMHIFRKIILLVLLAAVMVIAPYPIDAVRNDPNLILKLIAKKMTEDSPVDVSYAYRTGLIGKKRMRMFSFTPEESTEYTFAVSNIVSEDDVFLSLEVADSHLNNYLSTDNMDERSDSFEDTAFLTAGNTCYIVVEAISENDRENYSGSFSLNVTKASEDARPNEVTETESAVVRISEDNQSAVLFIPGESGFFRFNSMIISKDKAASSSISSITTADNKEIKRSEGLCYLEGGKEYYIWISAHELSKKKVKAEVSCKRVETLKADQPGEYSINEGTIIEYDSRESQNLAVYSVSDGNVRCSVYDSMGFPLNSDSNSGGELSGNEKDFALVIQAQSRSKYMIFTDGRFSECRVVIARYTGDGSSLGPDDIEIAEPEEAENGTEAPEDEPDNGAEDEDAQE